MVDLTGLEVLNTTAFLLCVTFCAYVVSILILYLRTPPAIRGDESTYAWHLIVPCLNEANVISQTVTRLLADCPSVTVWCVDDGSTDGTGEVLAGLRHDRLRVVTRTLPEAQQGKGPALNAAWAILREQLPAGTDPTRVVVGIVDADSRLDPRCFSALAGPSYFGRDSVSAVQIEVRMHNRGGAWANGRFTSRWGRLLVLLQDLEFRGPIAAIQQLRRHTRSVGLGGNGQFTRLSTLEDIAVAHGTPWHGALLEDYELGLHILLVGGATEYCSDAWVSQEGLARARSLIRQRSRWAQGSMQCAKYAPSVLRSPHVRNSAALEIGYFLSAPWTQLVGSLLYVACLGVMAWYALSTPGGIPGWWHGGGWGVIPLVLVFGVAPFAIWGPVYRSRIEPGMGAWAAIGLGLCHWVYSYLQCIAVWSALLRLLRSRTDWQKTSRLTETAGRTVPPPRHRKPPAPASRTGGPLHTRERGLHW